MLSRLFFIPTLLLSVFSLPLSSYLSFPPFVASLGILSGSSLSLLFAPVSTFPSRYPSRSRSFFPIYLLPTPPAFPLRFPSPPPLLSLKVFAQSGSAQRGSTFCRYHPKWLPAAMSDAACLCVAFALLPSLRAVTMCRIRFWCRLCWWMLWITWYTIVSRHSPYYLWLSFPHRKLATASLWCLFVVSSLQLHRRGGLCGTSLWHIVRPVLQCSSPPLRYPAWALSSPHYDPFMTASPLFL